MIRLEGGLVLLSSFLPSNWEVLFLALNWASSVFSLFLLRFPSFRAISMSSTFMYFVALKSILTTAFGSFFWTKKRNSHFLSSLEKAVTRTILSTSSISRASLLNQVTYDLRLSSSLCLIYINVCVDRLCLCPPIKWVTKLLLNSLEVEMEFGLILLNQTRADLFRVVRKSLHIISSGTPWMCMRVLKDSK